MPDHWLKIKERPPLLDIDSMVVLDWLACSFLLNLGSTGLIDETEPLFAESALSNDGMTALITLLFNGETTDKPP